MTSHNRDERPAVSLPGEVRESNATDPIYRPAADLQADEALGPAVGALQLHPSVLSSGFIAPLLLPGSNYLEPTPCFCQSCYLHLSFTSVRSFKSSLNLSLFGNLFFSHNVLRYECVCVCVCIESLLSKQKTNLKQE